MISHITTEIRNWLWSKTDVTILMPTRLFTFHSKTLTTLSWGKDHGTLLVPLSHLEDLNPGQKFRGFPVSMESQDAAKASCCPSDGMPRAEGWAATRLAGQRHHWPWWGRACCDGSRGHLSTQIIRQADNQMNLSSSLLLPILKLCKVLENLFASLLMVMAVADGCIVSVIFFPHSLVGAILFLLAMLVAFCGLSAILRAQVKLIGCFKVSAFLAVWKVINSRKLLNYFMGRKPELISLGIHKSNGGQTHHGFCYCAPQTSDDTIYCSSLHVYLRKYLSVLVTV